jgi:hypothetical protein
MKYYFLNVFEKLLQKSQNLKSIPKNNYNKYQLKFNLIMKKRTQYKN